MGYYLVIKTIRNNKYYYYQRTERRGTKVHTHNIYVGPVNKIMKPAPRLAYSAAPSVNGGMKGNIQRFGRKLDMHENHTFSNACPTCMKEKGQPVGRDEPASWKGIDKAIAEKGFYESPECKKRMHEMEKEGDKWRLVRLYGKLSRPEEEDECLQAKEELIAEHGAAIEANGADAFNLGWYQDDFSIASKTDKGVMTTTIHADGTLTHAWDNDR